MITVGYLYLAYVEHHPRATTQGASEVRATPEMDVQQRNFDAFQREYKEERPHERFEQQTQPSQYHGSPRDYPTPFPANAIRSSALEEIDDEILRW